MSIEQDVAKIKKALEIARETAREFTSGKIEAELKSGGDPVTAADLAINKVLLEMLVEDGDGWLSEETLDSPERLEKSRVWIVDPVDGTKEFVEGIDEWCISIGLAIDGKVVAGGICNPATDELFLGSIETPVTLNGSEVRVTQRTDLQDATVLASRSELKRGEWERFKSGPLSTIPMGSVAYKLARVSAGLDDATFTLVPKNEWDIAAGIALVQAAGGKVVDKEGKPFTFNNRKTLVTGMIACGGNMFDNLMELLEIKEQ
jgi:myo-inositol-1(or 4)-monophosphatase